MAYSSAEEYPKRGLCSSLAGQYPKRDNFFPKAGRSGLRGRKVSRPHCHHDPVKMYGEGREERDGDYLRAINS
jgi:hypothetical protein